MNHKIKLTLFSLSFLLFSVKSNAQPIIEIGSTPPSIGNEFQIMSGMLNSTGESGENVIWDFSNLAVWDAGTQEIVAPAIYGWDNLLNECQYAYISLIPDTLYSFFKLDSTEFNAYLYRSPGYGEDNDYHLGPKKFLQFPFEYTDSYTVSYDQTGSNLSFTVHYDAYGTLILPFGLVYENVVRIKETYSSTFAYTWYTLDPLLEVARYSATSEELRWLGPESIPCNTCQGDFNNDGEINTSDLLQFLALFGSICG